MFKVFLFPLLLCTLSSCLPSAILEKQIGDEKTSSPFTPAFNAFVQQNLDYWHVPGLSVAIVDENDTLSKVSCSTWTYRKKLTPNIRVMAYLHFRLIMLPHTPYSIQLLLLKLSPPLLSRS